MRLRLALSNRPDNVPVVRQALAGLADATGLSPGDLNDIGTAVTEACNNVSAHAYGGGEGPLEVELHAMRAAVVVVTVRDRGVGLALDARALPEFPADVDGELAGIGLPSIKALASEVRWTETAGGGTSVQMTFSTAMPASWGWADTGCELGESPFEPGELGSTIEVAMAPLQVAREVLVRLLHATAARARFSIDRHAEIQRVGAALLADPQNWTSSGGIHARLIAGTNSLELAIGPISRDRAELLAQTAAREKPRLRDSMRPADEHGHTLVVRLAGARS